MARMAIELIYYNYAAADSRSGKCPDSRFNYTYQLALSGE